MMKFAASLLFAGALLVLTANAQTPPDIQPSAKSSDVTQAPAPVIAPLGVGTAFNASLEETLDTRKDEGWGHGNRRNFRRCFLSALRDFP